MLNDFVLIVPYDIDPFQHPIEIPKSPVTGVKGRFDTCNNYRPIKSSECWCSCGRFWIKWEKIDGSSTDKK
jgi:hypothetical protein